MDPLRENAHGGAVKERKANGLDAKEVLQEGGRTATEREAQTMGLLREAERQTDQLREQIGQLEEQTQLVEQNGRA